MIAGRTQAIVDHQVDALVQHLRTEASGLEAVLHGWPDEAQNQGLYPLPHAAVVLAGPYFLKVRRPFDHWVLNEDEMFPDPDGEEWTPDAPGANRVTIVKVGQYESGLQVEIWCKDRTQRMSIEFQVDSALRGWGSATATATRILTLPGRYNEIMRVMAGQFTRDDEDGRGLRSMLPTTVRSPYLIESDLPLLTTLDYLLEIEPEELGVPPETIVIFEP